MAAVRPGWTRYAIRLQYHGGSFLGFARQPGENSIMLSRSGAMVDLRGYTSVETRLCYALTQFLLRKKHEHVREKIETTLLTDDVETENVEKLYDNLQVSSRTDRGVHALNNSLHVDICDECCHLPARKLARGLDACLRIHQQHLTNTTASSSSSSSIRRLRNANLYQRSAGSDQDDDETDLDGDNNYVRWSPSHDVRILSAQRAPDHMILPPHRQHSDHPMGHRVAWNARYSATQRTYVYRILLCADNAWYAPFEWDRSWSLPTCYLDVNAMRQAASHWIGQHDFRSFRGKHCQRVRTVMRIHNIDIHSQPYPSWLGSDMVDATGPSSCQLVTIRIQGDSFLYHQVRNMTGCLVEVGRGRLTPRDARELLLTATRCEAPFCTAPPHGLFLTHVQHGEFDF